METDSPVISMADNIVQKLMKHEDHLSYSSLIQFRESPRDFIEYKLGRKDDTAAMIFGKMIHCLVLEPTQFDDRYFCLDDTDICAQIGGAKPRATTKYREWKQAAVGVVGDRAIVNPQDTLSAKIIASCVRYNRASRKILELCGEREQPIEWEFKNFKFKGFIDGKGPAVKMDLKTCADANPEKFSREIIRAGYHIQAAMYCYATGGFSDYYIVAVDKTGGVSVHKLSAEVLELGMGDYIRLLDHFNHCILTDGFDKSYDFWAERYDGIFVTEKPHWL